MKKDIQRIHNNYNMLTQFPNGSAKPFLRKVCQNRGVKISEEYRYRTQTEVPPDEDSRKDILTPKGNPKKGPTC